MNIKKIINGYLGSTQLNSIYRGFKLIWPKFNKYLIGGNFYSYSPNDNLYEDQKDSILIARTYNGSGSGSGYEDPPFNGLTNNIVVTLDNSTQIDPEFSVMKINRKNSNVSQMDYVQFLRYDIEPGKIMEMSLWYYGTYGTAINIYALDAEVYVERWDASTNAYITNNSSQCIIPVTTNTWQYVKVRATNTHTTLTKRGLTWVVLHDNQRKATLSNTEYWKITCVKHWYVESVTKNKIIRLNNDYSVDDTWYNNSSYTSGAFEQLIYDNVNKKVYGAGDPALDGGLVRFNLDGTKDSTFNIGTGFNARVRSIIIDNINSKIYVGGDFTTFQGNTQNRIARLNMDGSLDNTFNIGTGFNNVVFALNIDTINQKLYVGGTFTAYQGVTQNRIVCLNYDGSKDTSFNVGTGLDSAVRSITIDNTNSKIYIAGQFTIYNGSTQNRLIRLNMNGTKDTSFNIGTGFDGAVYGFNLDNVNSKIYAGGPFTTYNGSTQNRLIRLNMNGTKDTSFNIGTGLDSYIYPPSGILIDNEKNKIYIIGNFTKYNDQQQKYIARLNMNGSLDNTFNIQLGSAAYTILQIEDIPIVSLEITGDDEVVNGNTLQLGIEYKPSNTTQIGVVWSSSDETKATVNSSGLVTAIAGGDVIITATSTSYGSITDTHNINIQAVVIPIVSLEITGDNEVNEGNNLQLGISYNPSNTTQTGVVWSSSDETKATVDSNGLVTTIADGSVVITATSTINGAINDTHNVTINEVGNLYAVIKVVGSPATDGGYGIKEYNGWTYSIINGRGSDHLDNTFYWSDNSVAGRMMPLTISEINVTLNGEYRLASSNVNVTLTLPTNKWYPDIFYGRWILRCANPDRYQPFGATGYKIYNLSAGTYIVKIWDCYTHVVDGGMLYNINGTRITPFTGNRFTNSSPNVHGTSTSKPQLKEVTVTIGTGENINIITHMSRYSSSYEPGAAISAIELEKIA